MKIKNIRLSNFRRYDSLELDLPSNNFIVLIGKNGVGKSTILDSISLCLAHVSGQLCSMEDNFHTEIGVKRNDIRNNTSGTSVDIFLDLFQNQDVVISCTKNIDQNGHSYNFLPKEILSDAKMSLKTNYSVELPLLVYYRTNRTFSIKHDGQKVPYYNKVLEGYRNSFSPIMSGFTNFEDWFISEENIENQQKIASQSWDYEKNNLKVLRSAITSFLSNMDYSKYTNLRVERRSESNLVNDNNGKQGVVVVDKGDITISMNQLSSGEKMIIYLVADITRRLLILNHNKEDSLDQAGIVLIDELEMHLHPNWQRNIVKSLQLTFPKLQFIATTHSPQVIANLNSDYILELGEISEINKVNHQTLGVDSNSLLESVFDSSDRPNEIEILIDHFYKAMESDLGIEVVRQKLRDIESYKAEDHGQISDSLLDELLIIFSSYKYDKKND